MTPATVADLAHAREEATADLDAAIRVIGVAYGDYQDTTQALSDRLGVDLFGRLDVPIIHALVRAGLTRFLERKLVAHGSAMSLRALVEEQHHDRLVRATR